MSVMEYKSVSVLVPVLVLQFLGGDGLQCLEDEACRSPNGDLTGNPVENVTYCCGDPTDYVDMTPGSLGDLTCQCTTTAQAAAAYADRTMDEGDRSCHYGPECQGAEKQLDVDDYNTTYCCFGDEQYVQMTRFGQGNVVCRCQGSSLPPDDLDRYLPLPTRNASSSGEQCFYNYDCADNPSIQCQHDIATFCCYGSRGMETINDIDTNSTRCTCTNDFVGAQCEVDPPFPVDINATIDTKCRSGDECEGMRSSYTCSHGNTVFCCPRQGLNLTIVDDVISSCTCVSAGHQCNVTFTSSFGVSLNPSQMSTAISLWISFLVWTVLHNS